MTATSVRTINPSSSGISPWKAFKAKPEDWFDPEEIAKAREYQGTKRHVNLLKRVINIGVDLAIIRTHAMPNMLRHLGWNNWVLEVLAVIVVTTLVGIVVNIGFDWWESMIYDKKWGFSTMTPGTFWSDMAKGIPIGVVINGGLALALWWVIRGTDAWWIVGWAIFSVFVVGFAILFPKLIAPMFNKYTPLADEELHNDILAVAREVGADIEKVEVEDASKRDNRDNAYVAGMGKTRRVVIYDNMLERPKDQIRFVSAHEIGHWKLRHLVRQVPLALALIFVNFAIMKVVLENDSVLKFAGVKSLGDPGAVPLFFFVFAIPVVVTGLLSAYLSRVSEREADLFGLEAVPDPAAATAAMRDMSVDAKSDLDPSFWARLNRSHPPVAERLAMFAEWGRRHGANGKTATPR